VVGARRSGQRGAVLDRRKKKEEGKEGRKERKKRKKEKEKRKIGKRKIGKENAKEKEKMETGKEKRFRKLGERLGKLGGRRKGIFAGFSGFGC
jgi:hypothetical protein